VDSESLVVMYAYSTQEQALLKCQNIVKEMNPQELWNPVIPNCGISNVLIILNEGETVTEQVGNNAPTKRDAAKTRARILKAAKIQFSRNNYEVIGVRDIAAEANVDAALINRYFGSKEKLFEEAFTSSLLSLPLYDILQGELCELGESLTRQVVSDVIDQPTEGFNPLHLLLRSSMSHTVSHIVNEALNKNFVKPLAKLLEGEDAVLRSRLIFSHIIGFVIMSIALTPQDIQLDDADKIVSLLGTAIQACIEGDTTS